MSVPTHCIEFTRQRLELRPQAYLFIYVNRTQRTEKRKKRTEKMKRRAVTRLRTHSSTVPHRELRASKAWAYIWHAIHTAQ